MCKRTYLVGFFRIPKVSTASACRQRREPTRYPWVEAAGSQAGHLRHPDRYYPTPVPACQRLNPPGVQQRQCVRAENIAVIPGDHTPRNGPATLPGSTALRWPRSQLRLCLRSAETPRLALHVLCQSPGAFIHRRSF